MHVAGVRGEALASTCNVLVLVSVLAAVREALSPGHAAAHADTGYRGDRIRNLVALMPRTVTLFHFQTLLLSFMREVVPAGGVRV